MSSDSGAGGVKVLAKAAAVLNALAEGERTPAQLSVVVGEPRSTMYRVLGALQDGGLVEPGIRNGTYQLGMSLFTLGNAVARRFSDVRSAALPAMEQLHAATRQTIFLVVRRDNSALCVERLDGEMVGVMILPVGGTIPLHGGANARALLAFEPREVWDGFVDSGPLEQFTPATHTSAAELFAQLEQIKEQGYSVSEEDVIPGIASIGAPVIDHTQKVRAAISLSGPTGVVLGDDRLANIARVRSAAAEISRVLGGGHPS